MQSNLNRLALTFGRPVLGVHNRTSGVIFDVVECLIQRNFGYATGDVRICFRIIRDVLYDPSKSKVVFVLHSQGGIEGGLVLDWLLQELPQDLLSKLEVYTFGNAANHFNNPHRHASSQTLTKMKPLSAMTTILTETTFESPASSPQEPKRGINVKILPPCPLPVPFRLRKTGLSATSSTTLTALISSPYGAYFTSQPMLWARRIFHASWAEYLPELMVVVDISSTNTTSPACFL